jgi:O-antigen/teichoic acid export membrane protein
VWLAVFAEPIIRLLYGPNWAATALLVPWLCLAAAAKTPFSMFGPALQAINQPMRGAWASLPTLLLRLMFLAMVPANSIVWVVAALSLADVLALAAWLGVVRRVLHVPLWEFTKSHLQSGLVTLVSLLAALMLRYADSWMNLHPLALVPLSLLVVAAVSSWTVFRINHPFADELRKAVHMIRSKIKSGQDSAA